MSELTLTPRRLLSAWDSPALTYAIGHGWKRFSALPADAHMGARRPAARMG